MRLVAPFLVLALAAASRAQLAGKPDVAGVTFSPSAPLVDGGALLQLCLALGFVYVLVRYVAPRLMSKLGNRLATGIGSTIKTLETASCGTSTLQVVEVRGRTLLVAINPTGVNLISDLTGTIEPTPEDDQPAFFELLDARKQGPLETLAAKAVVEELPVEEAPKAEDFEESLRLLTEAKRKMEARQTDGVAVVDMDARKERLRRLTG